MHGRTVMMMRGWRRLKGISPKSRRAGPDKSLERRMTHGCHCHCHCG
jgi:hypothetical protein